MSIGPVQLIVLGFPEPNFHGEITAEPERLRESDTVRVVDALAVHKDAAGDVEVAHLSNLADGTAGRAGAPAEPTGAPARQGRSTVTPRTRPP
jgi:hypothetical protein